MACSPKQVLKKARIERAIRRKKTSAEIMEDEIDQHLLAEAIRTGKAYAEFAIPYDMQYIAPEIQHVKSVFAKKGWSVTFGGNPRVGHHFIFSKGKTQEAEHAAEPEAATEEAR